MNSDSQQQGGASLPASDGYPAVVCEMPETPRERKNRLARERRARVARATTKAQKRTGSKPTHGLVVTGDEPDNVKVSDPAT